MHHRVEGGTQFVEHRLKIGRHGAEKLHPSSILRMREREPRRMEKWPIEVGDGANVAGHPPMNTAIERVADNRMTDRAEVDANLVCSPGMNRHLHEREYPAEVLRADDARHRRPRSAQARRLGRHLLPVRWVAPD